MKCDKRHNLHSLRLILRRLSAKIIINRRFEESLVINYVAESFADTAPFSKYNIAL